MREAFNFFSTKILAYIRYYIWNFNETLTNYVVSFEQLGPVLSSND